MKWVNLIWSVVLLGALSLLIAVLSSNATGVIAPWFVYTVFIWIVICICSPIVFILRLTRQIKNAGSFLYILTGMANLAIGIIGHICLFKVSISQSVFLSRVVLTLNLLLACFIFVDAFVIPPPRNLRRTEH